MYKTLRNAFITSLFIGHGMMAACGSGGQVEGHGDTISRTRQALAIGAAMEINGIYGENCVQRSGAWSVGLVSFGLLTNAPLSVAMGDVACTLSVTSVRFGSAAATELYSPDAPIELGASFAFAGSALRKQPGDPASVYANFRIQPDMSYSQDFSVQMLYSDDPSATSLANNADLAIVSGQAAAGAVPAPDYAANSSGLHFQIDANKMVQSASGQVDLMTQGVSGQLYVIDSTVTDVGSYAAVDAAFLAGTAKALTGMDPFIPVAEFGLVGYQLLAPLKRNVIISNEVNGVRSYQIVTITFSAN